MGSRYQNKYNVFVSDAAEGETPVGETFVVVTESPDTVLEEVVPTEAAELDEVEKLLFPSSDEVGPTTPLPECAGSKFGCCPDGKTAGYFVVVLVLEYVIKQCCLFWTKNEEIKNKNLHI